MWYSVSNYWVVFFLSPLPPQEPSFFLDFPQGSHRELGYDLSLFITEEPDMSPSQHHHPLSISKR
jgi:hypothetical protein